MYKTASIRPGLAGERTRFQDKDIIRRHRSIRIENPVAGSGLTSLKQARRFVLRGLAVWTKSEVSIRFLCDLDDHRYQSVVKTLRPPTAPSDVASIEEVRNLPMVRPWVALAGAVRKRA